MRNLEARQPSNKTVGEQCHYEGKTCPQEKQRSARKAPWQESD
jgi:hypothetical protein